METVYIETSVVSLLVARPSRDAVTAAHQQVTRDWWEKRRLAFRCITSSETLREAGRGDAEMARQRIEILNGLPQHLLSDEAARLLSAFLATRALPPKAQTDAAHLAIATAVRADYLLTWNCRHLANRQIMGRLGLAAAEQGWRLPKVCTPSELMGVSGHELESDS